MIYFSRTWLDGLSLEDPSRDRAINLCLIFQGMRFDGPGYPNLETIFPNSSESGKLPSFRDLTASLPELSIKPLPMTTYNKHSSALLPSTIDRRTDVADIEDGVNYCRQLIASYPDHPLAAFARVASGLLLLRAFECTDDVEYLNGAISAARNNLNTPNTSFARSVSRDTLISSLLTRLPLLKHGEDLDEIIQLLAIAAENTAQEFHRLRYLCHWALVARDFGHSSVDARPRAHTSRRSPRRSAGNHPQRLLASSPCRRHWSHLHPAWLEL